MNRAIELHDTSLAEVHVAAEAITIRFVPAYVHQSEGRPGVDPGTGWTQDFDLVVSDAHLVGKIPPLPCLLVGGDLEVDGVVHALIPVALASRGSLRIRAVFGYADFAIEVVGRACRLEPRGEARFVETFPRAL